MADCTNGIEIEKNYFHTQATVFTKLYEILRNLNRTVLKGFIKTISTRWSPASSSEETKDKG
jgi:hypothetical protein